MNGATENEKRAMEGKVKDIDTLKAPMTRRQYHDLPEDDPRQMGCLLHDLARDWTYQVDRKLKHMGISRARWIVLFTLEDQGSISQKELAEQVGIESPSLVRLLDSLEKDGLVKREVLASDRRVRLVSLCGKADEYIEQAMLDASRLHQDIFDGFSAEELYACFGVLRRLHANMRRLARTDAG